MSLLAFCNSSERDIEMLRKKQRPSGFVSIRLNLQDDVDEFLFARAGSGGGELEGFGGMGGGDWGCVEANGL